MKNARTAWRLRVTFASLLLLASATSAAIDLNKLINATKDAARKVEEAKRLLLPSGSTPASLPSQKSPPTASASANSIEAAVAVGAAPAATVAAPIATSNTLPQTPSTTVDSATQQGKAPAESTVSQTDSPTAEKSNENAARTRSRGANSASKPPRFGTENISPELLAKAKALAQGYEIESLIPKKDVVRIAAIAKEPLTNTTLKGYIQKTQLVIAKKIDPKLKSEADKLLSMETAKGSSANVAAASVGLWMSNQVEVALYLMGSAVLADLTDVNNLNNYAAFLVMAGGEDLAVPILNKLSAEFPRNSTVLNNLVQAWFGLGDIEKTESYLNRCLAIAPTHSQANATKAFLEENRGNKNGAIEALKKSLYQAYSQDKDNQLGSLGYRTTAKDIRWTLPKKDDGLGLGRFVMPPRPASVAQSAEYLPDWQHYKEALALERTKLGRLKAEYDKAHALQMAGLEKLMSINPLAAARAMTGGGVIRSKANRKFAFLMEEGNRRSMVLRAEFSKAGAQISQWRDELTKKEAQLEKKFDPQFGESRKNPAVDFCSAVNSVRNEFLEKSNALWTEKSEQMSKQIRVHLNDQINYTRYLLRSEVEFNALKTDIKLQWLSELNNSPVEFEGYGPFCQPAAAISKPKVVLANWEELHCPSETAFEIYGAGSMYFGCTKNGFQLALAGTPLELKYQDNYRKGTGSFDFVVGWDKGLKTAGPVEVGMTAAANLGGFVEWDTLGISDVGVIAKVGIGAELGIKAPSAFDPSGEGNEVKLGTSLVDGSVRIGVNAGAKGDIKSILSGN